MPHVPRLLRETLLAIFEAMSQAAFREISLLIAQMRRLTSASVNKRLAVVGTSLAAYKVLVRLAHDPEAPQHELASDAAMDPAAVSRLIQGLVRDAYVTTRIDPTDKRQRFVKLTRKGRELERSLSPIVDAAFEPFGRVLTEREQQQLVAIMRKACDGVSRVANEFQGSEPARAAAKAAAPAAKAVKLARTRRRSTAR
jgi:DNA-binding MarR family transcriptional regulator